MILADVALFPGMMLPLHIFEPRYRQMLADVLADDRMFVMVARRPDSEAEIPRTVGGLGMVRASVANADGTSNLFLLGLHRVNVRELIATDPYPRLRIDPAPDLECDSVRAHAIALKVKELATATLRRKPPPTGLEDLIRHITEQDDPARLADLVAQMLIVDPNCKQELLATRSVPDRLDRLIAFLMEKA